MNFLGVVHACRKNMPVIAVTSTDLYHGAIFAGDNGVAACLAKPITLDELKLVVGELGVPKLLLTAS